MPNLKLTLEQQEVDVRSSDVTLLLTVANRGNDSVRIFSITPRLPEQAHLVEVKDSNQEAARDRTKALLEELTALLADHLYIQSQEIRYKHMQLDIEYVRELIEKATPPLSIWRVAFRLPMYAAVRAKDRRRAFHHQLLSVSDAHKAAEKYFPSDHDKDVVAKLFRIKVDQLDEIVRSTGDTAGEVALALIRPKTQLTNTYVLRCARGLVNPRRFTFSVGVCYGALDLQPQYTAECTTSLVISPSSYSLSLIALLSSILGVSLKYALEAGDQLGVGLFFQNLGHRLATGPGIAAGVLALVMFSIFEHTAFAKVTKLDLSWRSALVIGTSAGVFSDQFLAALKAFLGVH